MGKPALLIARPLQNGSELGEVPLSITTQTGETVSMEAAGLSNNRGVAWRFVDLNFSQATEQQRVTIQVGEELSPFRLRKTFVVEAIDAPPLLIDSPTDTDDGLVAGGTVRIRARFDGDSVSQATATAYVSDMKNGQVVGTLELACDGNVCEDTRFEPEPGRSYQIIVVGTAFYEGQLFSDGAISELITGDLIRLEGLDRLSQLSPFVPGTNPSPLAVDIVGYLQQGKPDLSAQIVDLRPSPAGMGTLDASFSPLVAEGNNAYESTMSFVGFDSLPPDTYQATLVVFSPTRPEIPIQPSRVEFQFQVVQPEAHLVGLPNPLVFGTIPDLREPQTIDLNIKFVGTPPFDVAAEIMHLTSTRGVGNPETIFVDVDRPVTAGQADQYLVTLRLSALHPLNPGEYRSRLRFVAANPANPALITPQETDIVFTIPQPTLLLEQIAPPENPVDCPQLQRETPPKDMVDFGVIQALDKPVQVDLYLDAMWVQETPELDINLLSLRRMGAQGDLSVPVRLEAGAAQRSGDGNFVLPLLLSLPEGTRSGTYLGEFSISCVGLDVEPEKLRLQFDARTNLWGKMRQLARPATCTLLDWYTLTPFPRLKGLAGWGLTLAAVFLMIASMRPNKRGLIQSDTGSTIEFSSKRTAFVVPGGEGFILSNREEDGARAVAVISIPDEVQSPDDKSWEEPMDLEDAVLVRPGVGGHEFHVYYWGYSPRRGRKVWIRLRGAGRALHHEDRFMVLDKRNKKTKCECTVLFEE